MSGSVSFVWTLLVVWICCLIRFHAAQSLPALCLVRKSCACNNIAEINMTQVNEDIAYYGANDTAVNASLTDIGTWDKSAVELLCKQAKCDLTELSNAVSDIQSDINTTTTSMSTIMTAKMNMRKVIDCKLNANGTRAELYDHYEALSKRYIILNNIREDLMIKAEMLQKEAVRCGGRSWLRQVLESIWGKV